MLRTRRSPWIIVLGVATLVSALIATYIAAAWRWVDCDIGGSPDCEPASLWQLYAAVAIVPIAGVMVIESLRAAGRPLLWFSLVIVGYGVWAGLAYYGLHVV
jgi:hypothetical protein